VTVKQLEDTTVERESRTDGGLDGVERAEAGGRRLRVRPGPLAACEARDWLREVPLPDAVRHDTTLVLSELVTNSLRHARFAPGECIAVEVTVHDDRVRVEVADPGPGVAPGRRGPRAPHETDGRGLHLVQELSAAWGTARNGYASVWAEITVPLRPTGAT
jgi:two-component sensor histidine kinase